MNTMKIPGFTAGDSLYASKTQYNADSSLHRTSLEHGNVVPQLPKRLFAGRYCHDCKAGGPQTSILVESGSKTCCDLICYYGTPGQVSCSEENCATKSCVTGPVGGLLG